MPLHTSAQRGRGLGEPIVLMNEQGLLAIDQRVPCDSSLRLAKSECNAYELFWFFLMWNFICMISTDVIPVQLVLFKFPEPLPDVSYLNVFKGNKHHYSNHRT